MSEMHIGVEQSREMYVIHTLFLHHSYIYIPTPIYSLIFRQRRVI